MLCKQQTSILLHILLMVVLTISKKLKSRSSLRISENGTSGLLATLPELSHRTLMRQQMDIYQEDH